MLSSRPPSISLFITHSLTHTMITINYSSYPHILDDILSYCDYSTHLAFRGTSKQFCDYIDAPVFKEIIVCRPSPYGVGIEIRRKAAPFRRLPYLPWPESSDKDTTAASASRSRQLSYATSVDFYGARMDLDPLMRDLKDVQILRRPKSVHSSLIAPTVVDFRHLTDGFALAFHGAPTASVQVKSGCKRLVLHLGYDAGHPEMFDTHILHDVDKDVQELEIVWTPDPDTVPFEQDTSGLFAEALGIFKKLLSLVVPIVLRGGKVVIAGVEKMHPSYFLFPPDEELHGQLLVDRVSKMFEDYIRQWIAGDNFTGTIHQITEEEIQAALPIYKTLDEWNATAPELERELPKYWTKFCIDESLLRPGDQASEYYEEWEGRRLYAMNEEIDDFGSELDDDFDMDDDVHYEMADYMVDGYGEDSRGGGDYGDDYGGGPGDDDWYEDQYDSDEPTWDV